MKQIIETEGAPDPVGPYSQAVRSGSLLFVSGQIPIDPQSGELVEGGIREQTVRVLENLKAVLEAAGSSLEGVVKTTVFLADLSDFPEMNRVYAGYFGESAAPARSTIQAAALPKGARVEIDAIAHC